MPTRRQAPIAAFVIGGAVVVAIALTAFLVIKNRGKTDGAPEKPVAKATSDKTTAPVETPQSKPAPSEGVTTVPFVQPTRGPEEEEDNSSEPKAPAPKTPDKINDPKLPDLGSILPKLPSSAATPPKPKGPEVAKGPPESSPADPSPPVTPKNDPPDSTPRGDGQIPAALLADLKASTVFIKVEFGMGGASGSGFVLRVTDDTALVVTNQHVAEPKTKQGVIRNASHEVVFHSGKRNEFSCKAELIAADAEHDLAILRITGVRKQKDFPKALNTTDKPALSETTPIYVIGFPFGEKLSASKGNPAVTIGRGTITSIREDDAGDTASIQIDGDANPGNSGGPVVDGRGRLVGVLQGGLPGTNINFCIPTIELTRVLTGRISNLMFRVARSAGDTIELEVRGDLVDPFNRVKSTSLRMVRADDLKGKPTVGTDGKWAALAKSQKTDLRIVGKEVTGQITLPLRRDRGRIEFHFQPSCVDKDGKTNLFAPVSATLNITDGPGGGFRPPTLPGGQMPNEGGPGITPPPGGIPPGGLQPPGVGPPGGGVPAIPPPRPMGPGGPPGAPPMPPRRPG